MKQPRLSQATSMPAICESLRKAALDPRIKGVYLNIDVLGAGWAKVQEIRTYLDFFKKSGKFTVAYMKRGGEKEYFLASACDEIYIPPTAQLSLRGLSVEGSFLRGVLDKVGVEPQVCSSFWLPCHACAGRYGHGVLSAACSGCCGMLALGGTGMACSPVLSGGVCA